MPILKFIAEGTLLDSTSLDPNFSLDKFFEKLDKYTDKKFNIIGSDPQMKNITASVKNSKVAGINNFLEFRRVEISWLDIKYEKNSVDKIISFIPAGTRHENSTVKVFKDMFYRLEYILKSKGEIIIAAVHPEMFIEASKEYFEVVREEELYSGEQPVTVLFFRKLLKAKKNPDSEAEDDDAEEFDEDSD